jgi:6-phosphogluconolactonase (cycloisomerase 2 family)
MSNSKINPGSKAHRFLLAVGAATAFSAGTMSAHAEDGGAVYLLTDSTAGNAVVAYARAADGTLSYTGTFPTGGLGGVTPGNPPPDPLGSENSLKLFSRFLLAVNAGSSDVSMFLVGDDGLKLVDREPSGGTFPVSVAVDNGLVYVLNAGNSSTLPNISGFTIDAGRKKLVPLPNSQRPLAGGSSASGAQVSFAAGGRVLVVTEKGDQMIDTYRLDWNGYASQPKSHRSNGAGPFGFAATHEGYVLVSEAGAGAASSYEIDGRGDLGLISGSVSLAGQTAPCWLVATPDGRYAYTGNAGTGAISLLSVAWNGSMTLVNPTASGTSLAAPVLDLAFTHDGKFLYIRDVGNATVSGFKRESDGSLTLVGTAAIPAGDLPAQGIAAR